MGMEVAACLYVGDSFEADVVGARGAGMPACWFNPRGAPPPNDDEGPDVEIRAHDELFDILGYGG